MGVKTAAAERVAVAVLGGSRVRLAAAAAAWAVVGLEEEGKVSEASAAVEAVAFAAMAEMAEMAKVEEVEEVAPKSLEQSASDRKVCGLPTQMPQGRVS